MCAIPENIHLGMNRDEVVAVLGEPDAVGGSSRKYKTPGIYRYGEIEYHFLPWKAGKLAFIFHEPTHTVLLK